MKFPTGERHISGVNVSSWEMKGRKKFFKDLYGKTEMITVYELHVFFSVNLILINAEHCLLPILFMMKSFIFISVNREFTQKL